MAITKAKKESLIAEITEALSGATSVAFVHFKGLSVPEANEMRTKLKEEGVKYTVVKKTLLKRVLDSLKIEGEMPDLPGEVAMAYLPKTVGEDMTAPARNLNDFVKEFKERLQFLGGISENRFLTLEETVQIAAIPPVPVLRGMFVNVINSPIQGLVIALDQIREKKA
jgi:large subunit ribosomal protein L10